ncbi:hypothetical protein BD560DRAFT_401553 [Blakeslea trispora]|nr:hypothetical protein BD560DRAFT_401553 [Blakeslea trispora]
MRVHIVYLVTCVMIASLLKIEGKMYAKNNVCHLTPLIKSISFVELLVSRPFLCPVWPLIVPLAFPSTLITEIKIRVNAISAF